VSGAVTRHLSSPCPSCGHRWLRAGPVPGGYARECPSCGWSQVARREDERFHPCPAGRHWGPRGAAGILPFTVRHGRAWVLLSRRSPYVQHGGTWSCFGGAADEGETPWQAAVREASEEISGIDVDPAGIAGEHVWECPAQCGWTYTTFLVAVPLSAAGCLPRVRVGAGAHAWETDELAWVSASRVHARDLHPAFASAWPALRERIEAVARPSA
jgi:8-oxo-dGTP diphosphatase